MLLLAKPPIIKCLPHNYRGRAEIFGTANNNTEFGGLMEKITEK